MAQSRDRLLYPDVQPFGVRVLLVEPGAFRSNCSNTGCVLPEKKMPKDYEGMITAKMVAAVKGLGEPTSGHGIAKGDVEKGVQAFFFFFSFDVVMEKGQAEGMHEYLRLPLGSDGSVRWEVKLQNLRDNLDATEHIWRATDDE